MLTLASNFIVFAHLFFAVPVLILTVIVVVVALALSIIIRRRPVVVFVLSGLSISAALCQYLVFCVWLGTDYWFYADDPSVTLIAEIELVCFLLSCVAALVNFSIGIIGVWANNESDSDRERKGSYPAGDPQIHEADVES